MLTIIHGVDIASSRKYLLEMKKNDDLILNGAGINLTDLYQTLKGGSLFTETKKIFIENFITKRKKSADFDEIVKFLNDNAKTYEIFLWEGGELTKSNLNAFKEATVRIFKLPQTLFQLLDSIRPQNGKALIKLFHETTKITDIEMIFFMFVRQIRILLALQSTSDNEIDELKRLAPWQKGKLLNQSKLFKAKTLTNIYKDLFEIEKAQKTGNLNGSLTSSVDFLLLRI